MAGESVEAGCEGAGLFDEEGVGGVEGGVCGGCLGETELGEGCRYVVDCCFGGLSTHG